MSLENTNHVDTIVVQIDANSIKVTCNFSAGLIGS